jgi:uncharacterized nucleotidyltransferase DUF6036
MTQEIELLKSVCQRLEHAGMPYMLTGSLAAHFYAVPRMTRDIDIVIEMMNLEVNKVFQIFQDDFYVSKDSIFDAIKFETMFNVIHNKSGFKVDFIIRKDLPYRNVEFQRRRQIEFDGIKIWIVSSEDLIISKLYWAKDSFSELQINDVRNLMSSIPDFDVKYIEKWVLELNLKEVYAKVQSQ